MLDRRGARSPLPRFRPCFGKGTEQGGNNVVVHVASAGGR